MVVANISVQIFHLVFKKVINCGSTKSLEGLCLSATNSMSHYITIIT